VLALFAITFLQPALWLRVLVDLLLLAACYWEFRKPVTRTQI